MEFNFNTRAEYKTQVAEWKLEYAELTKHIRDLKRQFVDVQRVFSSTGVYDYHWTSEKSELYWAAHTAVEHVRSDLRVARAKATEMIEERLESKIEAQRQYAASRA